MSDAETGRRTLRKMQANAMSNLGTALAQRATAERWVRIRVRQARDAQVSWAEIGEHLGCSGETARRKYGDGE